MKVYILMDAATNSPDGKNPHGDVLAVFLDPETANNFRDDLRKKGAWDFCDPDVLCILEKTVII